MKVRVNPTGLLNVARDKGFGVNDIAAACKISADTVSKIFAGTPVYLKTATRLFNGLDKDARLTFEYDASPASSS